MPWDIVPELPHPDLIYIDPPFFTQRDFESFDDRWASLQTYTDWLTGYCSVGWDALNPGGNFLIHLDWHAVHAMKVRLDHCFGGNFVNEIIWSYNSGGASKRRLSRKHDNILWYTKPGAEYTFNVIREPYATPDAADRPGFHPDGRMLTDVWQIPFLSTTAKERTGYPTRNPWRFWSASLPSFPTKVISYWTILWVGDDRGGREACSTQYSSRFQS